MIRENKLFASLLKMHCSFFERKPVNNFKHLKPEHLLPCNTIPLLDVHLVISLICLQLISSVQSVRGEEITET